MLQVHPDDRPDINLLLRRVRKALGDEASGAAQQQRQPAEADAVPSSSGTGLHNAFRPEGC